MKNHVFAAMLVFFVTCTISYAQEQEINPDDMKYSPFAIQESEYFQTAYELFGEIQQITTAIKDDGSREALLHASRELCVEMLKLEGYDKEKNIPSLTGSVERAENLVMEIKVMMLIAKDFFKVDEMQLKKLFFPMFKIENQIAFFKEKTRK